MFWCSERKLKAAERCLHGERRRMTKESSHTDSTQNDWYVITIQVVGICESPHTIISKLQYKNMIKNFTVKTDLMK